MKAVSLTSPQQQTILRAVFPPPSIFHHIRVIFLRTCVLYVLSQCDKLFTSFRWATIAWHNALVIEHATPFHLRNSNTVRGFVIDTCVYRSMWSHEMFIHATNAAAHKEPFKTWLKVSRRRLNVSEEHFLCVMWNSAADTRTWFSLIQNVAYSF